MRVAISDEFSCEFDDAQSKEMLEILNKSFGILEDLSLIGHLSSERGKNGMVHRYHARASKPNRTNQSKANQSQVECFFCKKLEHWKKNYPLYLAFLDLNRPRKKNQ